MPLDKISWQHWRRQAVVAVIDNYFTELARASHLLPQAHWHSNGIDVLRNIPYHNTGNRQHLLDIWRPNQSSGPLPIVMYIHGGGFRILSKDSHWLFALSFAKQGYLVFNINYRLAPETPYPAAHEDAATALRWIARNAAVFGGDTLQLILAGESAGANLALSLAVATSYHRPEPFARALFDAGVQPMAVLPACGLLQVSDPERFLRQSQASPLIGDYLKTISEDYLPQPSKESAKEEDSLPSLADPLLCLEQHQTPDRPLPAFFITSGGADPVRDDSTRLETALTRLGADVEAVTYPGEYHVFQSYFWKRHARLYWQQTFDFLTSRRTKNVPL